VTLEVWPSKVVTYADHLRRGASENNRRTDYGSGRRAGNLINVDFFVNCGSQQTLAVGDRIRAPDRDRYAGGRTLEKLRDGLLAVVALEVRAEGWIGELHLTPDSPERAIVLEQMPLHASQKRISWS